MICSPRVTVIVPTHDHPTTLDLAVGSALSQTVRDLDVVVIGDGVGDDTRAVMAKFAAEPRVRFLDRSKSSSRAEDARHDVLCATTAPFVCYLGDDDLMLADHIETMIELLADADFVHPLPMVVQPDGSLWPHPTDLAQTECIRWHLHPGRNAVSLTGVAHRIDAYRRLPRGWREAPPGRWSDHFMWEQWFRTPGLRFATGRRLTVLKFSASLRAGMSAAERRAELLRWISRSQEPNFPTDLAALVLDGQRRFAIQVRLDEASLRDEIDAMRATLAWRLRERARRLPGVVRLVDAIRSRPIRRESSAPLR